MSILAFFAGFLAVLLSLTFFGWLSFYALATSYALALHGLFFSQNRHRSFAFLAGLTLATELLGTARFGQASFLSAFSLLLYAIFQQRLRFTSLLVRFIVALFLMLTAFDLLLFSPTHLLSHFLATSLLFLLLAALSVLLSSLGKPEVDYELS